MAVVGKTAAIADALAYRLSSLSLSPAVPVAWPGIGFAPVVGQTYLEPSFLPNRTDYGAVGANAPRRHRGLYQVGVVCPINRGSLPGDEIADRVIEHFVGQTIARNDVRVRVGSYDGSSGVPWRSAPIDENGWRTIPVTIPWWADTF